MGEIVNLRTVKKRLARQAKLAEAAENRVRHGRTGAGKANGLRDDLRRKELLDGSRITPDKA
jgi:hypothetical protein